MNTNIEKKNNLLTVILAIIPLFLLGIVVYALFSGGPTKMFQSNIPPIENLHVMRHSLAEDTIYLDVINVGPDPLTIAQVMVRGAFWYHEISPKRELFPRETARVTIPYPWNIGEPIAILFLTSTGLTFDYEIEVASLTPKPTLKALANFAMLGVYVGVIPVALGICWFPFLRRLSKRALDFLLSITVGLLGFLVVDAVVEGLEISAKLPGIFHGQALLILGLIGAFLILFGIDIEARQKQNRMGQSFFMAWLIALGIGLHNLGEGLAIGSAYVLGELTLGALLVIGFTLHNATEGIAIVAPILQERVKLRLLLWLGILAGAPTIIGCWLGAFTYSLTWSVLFLGIGAGAILQVIAIIMRSKLSSESPRFLDILGVILGYLLMYWTGILVGGS
ncbi:MAG: ZIP family metal transporter [Bacteroidota bacterium]